MRFGPLSTDTRHFLRDERVGMYVRFEITDPRNGHTLPLPAGIAVTLIRGNTRTPHGAETDDGGCVELRASTRLRDVALLLEPGDRNWLDLDSAALLRASDLQRYERRPLVRLPSSWRSDEQPSVSDDRGGRFATGILREVVGGGQGTEDEPWVLRIDHAWHVLGVAFEYFDPRHGVRRKLTQGPMIEVYRGEEPDGRATIGASTILDDQGLIRVPLFRSVDPLNILVSMRVPAGTFIRMDEIDPAERVGHVSEAELSSLPSSARRRLYRLPETWLSRGQLAAAEDGEPRPFTTSVGHALSRHEVLNFDLDDVVLVDEAGVPIEFADELPIALFDQRLRVIAPDHAAPYTSLVDASENHFSARHVYSRHDGASIRMLRAIRRGQNIFDVTDRRTTRGRIVGVRAAVRNDHEILRRPRNDLQGVVGSVADVHYFRDVDAHEIDGALRCIDVALVLLTFRIRPVAGQAVAPADVLEAQKQLGIAADSWMSWTDAGSRDVLVRDPAGEVDVRFAFHFPALDRGRPHINLFLWKRREFRAHALLRIIALDADGDLVGESHGFEAEDGLPSTGYTLQHEIGHAFGLDDEYFEKHPSTGLPALVQPGDTFAYSFDPFGIMSRNALPRLRHYWALSRWLLQLRPPPVREHEYAVLCETSGSDGRAHRYHLPTTARSPFVPLAGPEQLRRGLHGRCRVELYLAGDDLDAFTEVPGVTAVLHVEHRLYARFPQNANGDRIPEVRSADGPVTVSRSEVLRTLLVGARGLQDSEIVAPVYCAVLDGAPPSDSIAARYGRRVLLHFLPRFTFSNPAAADFRLHVRASVGDPALDACRVGGRKLEITERFTGGALLCHMLGSTPRQSPCIEVVAGLLTSSISIGSSAKTSNLYPRAERVRGDGSFVGKGDDSASPVPLDPQVVARSIAEAINDPTNDFVDLATAEATGSIVTLKPAAPELELDIGGTGSEVRTRGPWRTTIEPSELQFLADWIGERLGARYRIERHDP